MNRAALRVQQREEEIKSLTKVGRASALQSHGQAAKLGFHAPPEVLHPHPVPGGE